MDQLLKDIRASAEATQQSVETLREKLKEESSLGKGDGVSLLSLKNDSLMSYLNSITLMVLQRVSELKDNKFDTISEVDRKLVENTVVQRVVLERGVKGLEKKISYQLDKLVRAYKRSEEAKLAQQSGTNTANEKSEAGGSDDNSDSDSDSDLGHRPNAAAFKRRERKESTKYVPPKIAAVAPPRTDLQQRSSGKRTRMQSMEEYLEEHGNAPRTEASIGSNIVDHGRGGIKTVYDRKKDDEVTKFEEDNMTRLVSSASKKRKNARDKRVRDSSIIGGEDFSIFDNNKEFKSSKGRSSVWDRAKRRKN